MDHPFRLSAQIAEQEKVARVPCFLGGLSKAERNLHAEIFGNETGCLALKGRAGDSGKEKFTGNICSKAPSVIAIAGGVLIWERFVPYALFDGDRQIGPGLPTEAAVWRQALNSGLISDIPVADEAGGQVLPAGYHVQEVREEHCAPDPAWKLPDEIS